MRFVCLLLVLLCVPPVFAQTSLTVPAPNWCVHKGTSVWQARRPEQNALARITIDLACFDDVVDLVRVKAETRCGRALCTWSFSEEARAEGPALDALFFTFAATRVMTLQLSGNQINVLVENDYNQPGRASDTVQAQMWLER